VLIVSIPFEPLDGRCMCGAVSFQVTAPLLGALYCHCTRCRRRSGTEQSLTALTQPGSFTITAGEDRVRSWDPGDGWIKSFCVACGSHTHTSHPENRELIAVRLGCIAQDPGVRPSAHQFVADVPAWMPLPDDGLPRFPGRISAPVGPDEEGG
jgi:hypothetical protein